MDGESSSLTRGPFHWSHIARTTVHDWLTSPTIDFWRGSHDGYARLADPALHERSILARTHGRYTGIARQASHFVPTVRATFR